MLARRELFGLAGRAGIVAVCSVLLGCRDEHGDRAQADEVDLDPDVVAAVIAVGRAYIAAVPGATHVDDLRRDLGLAGSATSVVPFDAELDAAVKADFGEGRIVLLDGWMLSRTEARLAALVALERAG